MLSHTHFFITQCKIEHLFKCLRCASQIRKVPRPSLPTLPSGNSVFSDSAWRCEQHDARLGPLNLCRAHQDSCRVAHSEQPREGKARKASRNTTTTPATPLFKSSLERHKRMKNIWDAF